MFKPERETLPHRKKRKKPHKAPQPCPGTGAAHDYVWTMQRFLLSTGVYESEHRICAGCGKDGTTRVRNSRLITPDDADYAEIRKGLLAWLYKPEDED